jgi:hypothetical protein
MFYIWRSLSETHFLLVIMVQQLVLNQNDFYRFKHHAYVEPYKFLIFMAALFDSEI